MKRTLENKVVIVTGASEGIGRAMCLELARRGAVVVAAARNENRLDDLKSEIDAVGPPALVIPTDITDESACKNLADTTAARFGRIDALVNNAGQTMWTTLEHLTDTSIFQQLMQVNYLGSVYCTYYALPYLRKTRGRIVAVSSLAGLSGVPSRSGYSASKHAMIGFFESLRIELKGSGVTVTIAAPDFVLSQIHKRALDGGGKPLGKSPMQESKIMSAERCAERIVNAMEKRKRLLVTSLRGKAGRWLKLLAPGLVDNIAAAAIKKRK